MMHTCGEETIRLRQESLRGALLLGLDIGMPLEGGKSGNQKKKKKVLKASQIQGGTDSKEEVN